MLTTLPARFGAQAFRTNIVAPGSPRRQRGTAQGRIWRRGCRRRGAERTTTTTRSRCRRRRARCPGFRL